MPDPNKIKVAKELSWKDICFSLAWVKGTSRLFVGTSTFKVLDVDLSAEKPQPKELVGHDSYVTGAALGEKHLITGGFDKRLIWWNRETGEKVRAVDKAHDKWLRGVVTTPDGKLAASIADDMVCRLWEAESGKKIADLKGHEPVTPHHYPSMLHAITISRDGKLLATGDKVGHICIWELPSGKKLTTLEAPGMYTWEPTARRHSIGGIRSLAFSHDNKQLAVGGMDKVGNIDHPDATARLEIFDWQAGKQTNELHTDGKFKGMIQTLLFHHAGEWLFGAGGGYEGFYLFADLKANKIIRQEKSPMNVHGAEMNEASDTIYAAGHNRMLIWDLKG